jgi:hypothetical protein
VHELHSQRFEAIWSHNGVTFHITADLSWDTASKVTTIDTISIDNSDVVLRRFYINTAYRVNAPASPSYIFGTSVDDRLDRGAYSFMSGKDNSATGDYATAHGRGLIASSPSQMVIGEYNEEDTDGDYLFIVGNGSSTQRKNVLTIDNSGHVDSAEGFTAHLVESYPITYNESPYLANCYCVVSAGICNLSYRGEAKAHAVNDVIMQLPPQARPIVNVWIPFLKNTAGQGILRIDTSGNVTIMSISSTTNTSRIYFNCSFPVVYARGLTTQS